MKRRILAGMLAAAVSVSLLAGCSGGGSAPASSAVPASGSAAFSYPMQGNPTITYWASLSTNVSPNYKNLGDTPFGKELMKETGAKIEFQHPPANSGDDQFNLILADGNLPDVMEYSWLSYPGGPEKAIQDGNIIKLNDVFEKYCPNLTKYLKEHPDIDKMVKTDEGDYYCFPFIRGDPALCNTIGPVLRKDWLDELGLQVPTTVDEWHDVLTQFKEKKGAKAPFTLQWTMAPLNDANPFLFAYGVMKNFYVGSDGKVHFGSVEDGYRQFLQTFSQWYKEGLVDKDIATTGSDQLNAKMTNGQAGSTDCWAGSGMGVWINAAVKSDPGYMLVAAPYPTLNKGDKPEMGQIESQYSNQGCVAITSKCTNIEAAARLLDYAYSDAGHMLYNFGTEGESYTMKDGLATYTDAVMKNPKGWPVAQSLSAYIRGNYNGPFVQDKRYLDQYYTIPTQQQANTIWGQTNAAKYALPPITPTADESKEYASIMNDINTYRDEMTLKFILGTESLDKFDDYVAAIDKMGLQRALEIETAALDRYNKR